MDNLTLFQFFHWYYSPEGNLWLHAKDQSSPLQSLGVTHVWLPPAYKSANGLGDPGYAVYDLYDLGEFDQKGSVRTTFGTKEEYLDCIRELQGKGIKVLADIVFNHKIGGDEKEKVPVRYVKEENRNEFDGDLHEAELFTKFTFPGRKGKYSSFIWDWQSFTGASENGSIAMIMNRYHDGTWEDVIADEHGNYDYLMGSDIEFRNPAVREELKAWGRWYVETTGVDGFRLDALKHITPGFFPEWLQYLKDHFKRDFLCIGEYWKNDVRPLLHYIDATDGMIQLFDVPLHFNFYDASLQNENYDLRRIFDNTLVSTRPTLAITFVDNHDTQPFQALQSTVEFWFKPLAYALILLREQGIPCVFYPALYEAKYFDHNDKGEEVYVELNKVPVLETLMKVRRDLAYGEQKDFFDDPHVIGWTREGSGDKAGSGIAVLLSSHKEGKKYMTLGKKNAGRNFRDAGGAREERITLDEEGGAEFITSGRFVAIWVEESYLHPSMMI